MAKAQEKRAEVDVEVQQEMNKVVLKAPQLPTPQPPLGAKRQGADGRRMIRLFALCKKLLCQGGLEDLRRSEAASSGGSNPCSP